MAFTPFAGPAALDHDCLRTAPARAKAAVAHRDRAAFTRAWQKWPLRIMTELLLPSAPGGLGKPISVVPHDAEMTTQQAAALLNVSRPLVSKLIKNGELAYEMRGTHRRIRFEEVMRYKQDRAVKRIKALAAMADLSEEYGLPD